MEYRRFVETVRRAEDLARRHPRLYAAKVLLWGALGFGFVLALLGLFLFLPIALAFALFSGSDLGAGLTLLFWCGVLLLSVLVPLIRALWTRPPKTEGFVLEPARCPVLFEEIERLREELDVPPIDEVVLVPDVNAGLARIPWLGPFGPYRHQLLLGLPLMAILDPEEFRSVLVHELGHLSRRHQTLTAAGYRFRLVWEHLGGSRPDLHSKVARVLVAWLNWYIPRFSAVSLVLARRYELEADALAAAATSPGVAGRSLIAHALREQVLTERYWEPLAGQAATSPNPPAAAISGLLEAAREMGEYPVEELLARQLQLPAAPSETHPPLAERVAALGETPLPPCWPREMASEHYLGALSAEAAEMLDRQWREAIRPVWEERHRVASSASRRREELLEKLERGEVLTAGELFDLGESAEALGHEEEAQARYGQLLERDSRHPRGHLALGRVLLRAGQEEGLDLVRKAALLDPSLHAASAELLFEHLSSRGRHDEAAEPAAVLAEQSRREFKALARRMRVGRRDVFLPHGLDEEQAEAWCRVFAEQRKIRRAWVVRKQVEDDPELPAHVVMLQLRGFVVSARPILGGLLRDLPAEGTLLIIDDHVSSAIRSKIKRISGAPLYDRRRWSRRKKGQEVHDGGGSPPYQFRPSG